MGEDAFEVQGDMVSEDDYDKGLAMKAYEATYKAQDATTRTKYFQGQRLLDAATKASELVEGDPFNILVEVKELGILN